MITQVNDISQEGFLAKSAIAAVAGVIPSILFYPLDRITSRCIAKQKYEMSFMKQTGQIVKDIIKKDGNTGLFYGLKSSLDLNTTSIIARFLTYDFILGRQKLSDEQKYDGITIKEPSFNNILLATLASTTASVIVTQPSEILKLKIQLEPLGNPHMKLETYKQKTQNILLYHNKDQKALMTPGLLYKVIAKNVYFMSEISLFYFLQKQFQKTLIYNEENSYQAQNSNVGLAMLSSAITSLITHPLEFLYHRDLIRGLQKFENMGLVKYIGVVQKNEGLSALFKGVHTSILRNSLVNGSLMLILQQFINYRGDYLGYRNYTKSKSGEKYKRGN